MEKFIYYWRDEREKMDEFLKVDMVNKKLE